MGNSQNINSEVFIDNQLRQFQQNTKFVKQIFDASFGEISVYQKLGEESQGLIAQKSRIIEDKDQFYEFYKMAEQKLQNFNDNLINLQGYKFQQSTEICGSQNVTHLYYEYFEHNLDKEINARHKKTEHFSEPELWYLIKSICQIGLLFQEQGVCHGDLRPQNIFITGDGVVKVADHSFTNQHKSGYIKTIIGIDNAYLSPLLMRAFTEKLSEPSHNQYKSDVYSLGLTVLESATLISAQTIYDWQDGSLNECQIQDLLQRVQQRYSEQFLNTIKAMLQSEEDRRPDFAQLQAIMNSEQLKEIYITRSLSIVTNLFSPSKPTYESFRNTTESPFSLKSNTINRNSPSLTNTIQQSPSQLQDFVADQNEQIIIKQQSQPQLQVPRLSEQFYADDTNVNNSIKVTARRVEENPQLIYYHNQGNQFKKPTQLDVTQKTNQFMKKPSQQPNPYQQIRQYDIDKLIIESRKNYPNK